MGGACVEEGASGERDGGGVFTGRCRRRHLLLAAPVSPPVLTPPELQLVVSSAWRPGGDTALLQAKVITEILSGPLDWRAVLFLVERHRVPVLVYAALRGHGAAVPPEVLSALRDKDRACRMQAMHHAAALAKLLKQFAGAGVEAIPLKGAWLSHQLYGDVGLRHAKDIDLLVHKADLRRAREVLAVSGYGRKAIIEGLVPTPRQERYLESIHYHETHLHAGGTEVELHWGRPSWSSTHLALLWQRATTSQWMGATFRSLDDDMLLLFLCDHGAHHRWFRVKWLSDVAMLLSYREDDGEKLVKLAKRLDQALPLAQACLLVERLYGVPVPLAVKELAEQHPEVEWLVQVALKAISGPEEEGLMRVGVPRRLRFQMRLRRRHEWPSLVRQLLISPYDFQAVPLPDALFPLYALVRPVMYVTRRIRDLTYPASP